MDRDKVSEEGAYSLVGIQMPLDEKKKRADIIVDNNKGPEELRNLMDRLFERCFENTNRVSKELDR